MKILFFDSNSLWVCARRMEQGRLHWPTSDEGRVQLTRERRSSKKNFAWSASRSTGSAVRH